MDGPVSPTGAGQSPGKGVIESLGLNLRGAWADRFFCTGLDFEFPLPPGFPLRHFHYPFAIASLP